MQINTGKCGLSSSHAIVGLGAYTGTVDANDNANNICLGTMLSVGNYLDEAHALYAKMKLLIATKKVREKENSVDLVISSKHKIII